MTTEDVQREIKQLREDIYPEIMAGHYNTARNLIDRVENLEYLHNTRRISGGEVHCLVCTYCGGTAVGQHTDECQICEGYGTTYK